MNFFRVIINLFHFNRTNWKAVTLCLLAALVFWFFNALNKDYSTNLRFPVGFQFDRDKYVPVEPLPRAVFMNVSGNGWDLLRKSLGVSLPEMDIPLERPTEVKKIVGSTLPALLAGQLDNLRINHVVTDTLYLALDPKVERKIRVAVDPGQFTFAEGYDRLSPIVVLPDSVLVRGPKSIVDQQPDSLLLQVREEGINDDFREKVAVPQPDDGLLQFDPQTVEVIFEVAEWMEISKGAKLMVENIPGGARINLVKDSIQCQVRMPREQVENQEGIGELMAVLDLNGVKKGSMKLLPRIEGLPPNARLVHVDSVSLRLY
ncbi:MAG TPA: hypothetical protein PKW06_05875 [Cyclobacteriaceae bacterium]|nr:hypothetical protein [Cyclobacteriaceae bacterium]MCB9237627.1 hypothetical protein [Flammeovirgaceae bacterium]MCB0498859.1 hypothetical protein [Cyclobacteriaceae bacterium]MCO5270271.1 hypothetical protein [Cyclobacteriaceae bacterium]MCW5902247.1 hypothetical protein [Cyclobacteriaceae bacterium]